MKIDLPSFIPDSAACRPWHARHPKPMAANELTNKRPTRDAQILHERSSAAIRCGKLCRDPCQQPNRALLACDDSFQPQLCSEMCSTSIVGTVVGAGQYIHSQMLHTMLKNLWIATHSERAREDRENQTKIRNPGIPPTLRVCRILIP